MLRVKSARRDAVYATLFAAGAAAIHDEGGSVTTHFPREEEARSAAAAIEGVDADAVIELSPSPDVDYSQWRASVGAWEVGNLTVCPPWLAAGRDPARTIVIDPAMAFGTGEHPTTRGTLLLMQQVVRPGDTVLDVGSGSGVLAIGAARLGAKRVIGVEHEPDAVTSAEANVRMNGVEDRVSLLAGDARTLLPLLGPARVALANIASLALLQLLPVIHAALEPGGAAVISGVLTTESAVFRSGLAHWQLVDEHVESDWWTGILGRR